MTPNGRQQQIIHLLDQRRYDTIGHLALEFGVSWDTISRDIVALNELYPINTQKGRNGGISLPPKYELHKKKYMTPIQAYGLRKAILYVPDEIKEILETLLDDFAW